MKWHTKCKTNVQKIARELLRETIRALERAKSYESADLDAVTAFNLKRDIENWQRIVTAFAKAHSDDELRAVMHLAFALSQLNSFAGEEVKQAERQQ